MNAATAVPGPASCDTVLPQASGIPSLGLSTDVVHSVDHLRIETASRSKIEWSGAESQGNASPNLRSFREPDSN